MRRRDHRRRCRRRCRRTRAPHHEGVGVLIAVVVGDIDRIGECAGRGRVEDDGEGSSLAAAHSAGDRLSDREVAGRAQADPAQAQVGVARVADGEGVSEGRSAHDQSAEVAVVGDIWAGVAVGDGDALALHVDFGGGGNHISGNHIIGRAAVLEVYPADILPPGVAVEGASGRVHGHPAVTGVEVDPTHVHAPGVARQVADAVVVDAVVGSRGVGMGAGAAGTGAQPHPADVLGPGIALQVVAEDSDAAVVGGEVDPAGIRAPGPFVGGVNVAGGQGCGDDQQGQEKGREEGEG